MENNTIGQQIILLRNKFKMTQEDLAIALGYSKQTISNWETGLKTPRMGAIQKLADHFNVSKSFLIDGKDTGNNISKIYNQLDSNNQKDVYQYAESKLEEQNNNVIDLRTYRDVYLQSKLSAGTGIVDLDPQHKEIISYAGHIPDKYDLAFEVSGDSMEPLFEDGEVVFVKCDDDVRNGQIGVVMIGSDAYVKKMYVEDGQIRLVSLNKNYDDIIATSDIKVIGRIIM